MVYRSHSHLSDLVKHYITSIDWRRPSVLSILAAASGGWFSKDRQGREARNVMLGTFQFGEQLSAHCWWMICFSSFEDDSCSPKVSFRLFSRVHVES